MHILDQIWLMWKQKFWYPRNEKPPRHFVCIVFWSSLGSNGPKMPIFGQKSQIWPGRVWPKNPNFMRVSKSFGTHITEKPPGQLIRFFLGRALNQMGQKCPYLAKNASFGPKLGLRFPEKKAAVCLDFVQMRGEGPAQFF